MLISDLIGGNEIKGFDDGIVIVDGKELKASYKELVQICGNVPINEIDIDYYYNFRISKYKKLIDDYLKDNDISIYYIEENMLMANVAYSSYELDFDNRTLVLKIDAYDFD